MPDAISFRTGVSFGDPALPVIPYTLPTAPAARARFLATIGTTADPAVTSWTSVDGATVLTPVAGTAPGKSTIGGHSVARFNGTSSQIQAPLAQARPHSLAVTFFVHALPTTVGVIVGGIQSAGTDPATHDSGMLQIGDAQFGSKWNFHGGTAGDWGPASTGWHTAVASFGATDTTGRIDGAEITRNIGQVPRRIITLGGHRGAYYLNVSVAELVVWDGELTETQRATIEAAMRDHYGI